MSYLGDINVISELVRQRPNPGVVRWASGVMGRLALSVVTVEEIRFGLAWRSRTRVETWFDALLRSRIDILPITEEIASCSGQLRGRLQAGGQTRSQSDMLIGATSLIHGLTLVTRNVRDFEGCGIAVLNPFT